MSEQKETRANAEEMKKVMRYWGLPQIQLGPGAVAHLLGSKRMTVSFIEQEPHCSFKVHSHDNEEIVVGLEGERDQVLDGKLYRIKEGDILIVPPGSAHGSHTYESGCKVLEIFAPRREDLLARLAETQKSP
jgi:quercetin dioxygenase-like cupin family protein